MIKFSFHLVCIFFLLGSTKVYSSKEVSCDGQSFINQYYLLDVSMVGFVSELMVKASDEYLKNLGGAIPVQRDRVESFFDHKDKILLGNNNELFLVENNHLPEYWPERNYAAFVSFSKGKAVVSKYEVKQYNKKITPVDKHPLLGKIKRKERPLLIALLKKTGEWSPGELVLALEVEHEEIIYPVKHYGVVYGAISIDQFHISNYGLPNTNVLLKLEIYPESVRGLTESEQNDLNISFCQVSNAFVKYFPDVKKYGWFGYAEYHGLANKILPIRKYLQKYPLLYSLGQIIVLIMIGFLVLYLLIGRYARKNIYKEKVKN